MGCSFTIILQSASLKISSEVKSVLREQCCVKGQYTEQWKYFEKVHSFMKRNYKKLCCSDEVLFT
jgi:hypothetical protein